MKFVDLNPSWVGAGGEGISDRDGNPVPERHGVAVTFDCPCGCDLRAAISFTVALDGKPWRADGWTRTGDTFETLTLNPSIQRFDGCRWHGFIRNGQVVEA
jgi:hypothetical protein